VPVVKVRYGSKADIGSPAIDAARSHDPAATCSAWLTVNPSRPKVPQHQEKSIQLSPTCQLGQGGLLALRDVAERANMRVPSVTPVSFDAEKETRMMNITGDRTGPPHTPSERRMATISPLPRSCPHSIGSDSHEAYCDVWTSSPDRDEK
jgi:hypothetical protein